MESGGGNFQRSEVSSRRSEGQTTISSGDGGGKIGVDLFERGLCLLSGTAMTNSDLDRIIETILKCRKP